MKKWEKKSTRALSNAIKKRWLRALATKSIKSKGSSRHRKIRKRALIDKLVAPSDISIYKAADHEELVSFVDSVEKRAQGLNGSKNKKVYICFRNTREITSAAGIWLLARFETIVANYPEVKFSVTRPPELPNRVLKGKEHIVDSVLNRIGFYELLGQPKRNMKEISNVKCWNVVSDVSVVGEKLGCLLDDITEGLGRDYKNLYRPLVEAVSNSVEHAYRQDLYSSGKESIKKWWCFAAVRDNALVLLICDLGVGIPRTLTKTQSRSVLDELRGLIGRTFKSDGDYIEASLQVKKTSTGKINRGKGGRDFQSVISKNADSMLSIFSNKGYLKVVNKNDIITYERPVDRKQSINGTILQWNIKLPQEY